MDSSFLLKFGFPPPFGTAAERMRHRMTFRNERTLYRRTSSLSGKPLISIYSPESTFPIYSPEEWWSEQWDGTDYGREVDFTRPFFEQFADLQRMVPRISLFNVNPENSEYCQQAYDNRNCYFCIVVMKCEDCQYLSHSNNIKDSLDCDYLERCELCYDCVNGDSLYGCIGSDHCHNCYDLLFCNDCIGCKNCIGCWGLRNEQYRIFNVPYAKEEYESFRAKIVLASYIQYEKWSALCREEVLRAHPRSEFIVNSEESTGNFLVHAKACTHCFDAFEVRECTHCTWTFKSSFCAEAYGMGSSEWTYESVGVEQLQFGACNTFVSHSGHAFYSDLCFYCSDIFGCVGLRNKKHAILNKEYEKNTYKSLREKLVAHMQQTGEWGRFFPSFTSPFAYNESVAQERFPLTKELAMALGYRWREEDRGLMQSNLCSLPDNSREASKELLSQTLQCIESKKPYRIQSAELSFYQKQGIPIPRICPERRYQKRMERRQSL